MRSTIEGVTLQEMISSSNVHVLWQKQNLSTSKLSMSDRREEEKFTQLWKMYLSSQNLDSNTYLETTRRLKRTEAIELSIGSRFLVKLLCMMSENSFRISIKRNTKTEVLKEKNGSPVQNILEIGKRIRNTVSVSNTMQMVINTRWIYILKFQYKQPNCRVLGKVTWEMVKVLCGSWMRRKSKPKALIHWSLMVYHHQT